MIDEPHVNSHSIQARIWLGIAMLGAAVLVAMALTSAFVMR